MSELKGPARILRLYEQHAALAELCAEMHDTGVHVNQRWRKFALACVEQSIAEKTEKLASLVSHPNWKPTPNRMRSLLYKRHETKALSRFSLPDPFDSKMYTDETCDSISVDEKSLLLLMVSGVCPPDLVPIIEAWWEYQGEVKRKGTLASRDIDEATGSDGRLRPGWNSCGTDTGRWACSSPNIMNLEQDLRVIFGPPSGRVWVHGDFSQLEIRVMSAVAGDSTLVEGLATGDVYSHGARSMFNLGPEVDVKKEHPGLRKAAKIVTLARQYGAGIKTVYAQALRQDRRFTLERIRTFVAAWDKAYTRTVSYWSEEMERVLAKGYSESRIMGRRRSYPLPPERSEVANYPIQSTAADIANTVVLSLWKRLRREIPDARIVTQVHDAYDVECSEADSEAVRRILREEMESEFNIDSQLISFPTEIKVATHADTWQKV